MDFSPKDIIARIFLSLRQALAMSQTQTRKQKILGDVKKKRRQRAIISITIAVALIAIIVGAVIFLRPAQNVVPLPDYLSRCVLGNLFYHSHPNITVTINGANVPIADNTFAASGGCGHPLHTHDASGVIHVETDVDRDYTLGDWFLIWGNFQNDRNYAIFNSTQIFSYKVDPMHVHHLTMTVNGVNDTTFGNHVIPRNASPNGGTGGVQGSLCAAPSGQACVKDNIVITYG